MSSFTEDLKSMEELLKSSNDENIEDVKKCIKECSKNLRSLNNALKSTTNVGTINNLLSVISRMMGCRTKLKAALLRGGGYKPARPNRKDWTAKRIKWEDMKSVFGGRIRTSCITNLKHKDPIEFLEDCGPLFVRRIANILKKEPFLKVNTIFCGKFAKFSKKEEIEECKYLNTKNKVISRDTNLTEWFAENVMNTILSDLDEFQERDSGWTLTEVVNITININKYTPLLGSSYIELPQQIKRKEACINVQNNDEACFAWAVVSALYPAQTHPHRVTNYPHYSTVLNLEGITFPVSIPDIGKVEKQNNISINVYVLSKSKGEFSVAPTRLTNDEKEKHVNLLLVQNFYDEDEGTNQIKYHYVWIKNLSRLASSQLSNHHSKKFFCNRCLHYFYTSAHLEKHSIDCKKMNNYKVIFPKEGKLKFENFKNKERAPFIIYADFECILKPVSQKPSNTKCYQQHEAHSVGYYFKCCYDDTISYYKSYRGHDSAKWFAEQLQEIAENVESVHLCAITMIPLTSEESQNFINATNCHICEKSFAEKEKVVRDHCHLTGKYRGPAHESCNINYQDSRTIPVVFHNLSNYDAHLLIKDVSNAIPGNLKIIPNNTEKYISMVKKIEGYTTSFKFIDSFRFMASSLDKLASYLQEKRIVRSEFPHLNDKKFNLLTRKGVFPYEHIQNWENLQETQLPPFDQFYCTLSECNISKEEYEHALMTWQEFEIKTLGEYSDLYLKTDVLLLADIFENFRDTCIKDYDLDPAHYYTSPGLAWDAMLKYTEVELDYISDVDILMFLEKGIRGGLTQCSKRYAKANNKYMQEYDPNQPNKFLMYFDINAMYSWAMSQYLPYGELEWIKDVDAIDINTPDDSPLGYILEVDLEYPEDIHNRQKDLPMAPEKCSPPGCKEQKMMATLNNKKNYVVHYRNLKQYLSEGLKITTIHKALKFKQSNWMKKYIDLNANLRKNAQNEFEKNLYKLLCNAVFGKTMENVRLRRDIKLKTAWEGRYGAEALISKPNFHSRTIFDDNLIAIELLRTEVLFNKPIFVGMCILEISKTILYEFHYKFMKEKYGDECNLCYTDTDSLIYEIQVKDVYADLKENLHRFDTSDYCEDNPYDIPRVNKKVPGLMKDENNGSIMLEFVGLRAKMYSLRIQADGENQNIIKKAKGVKSYVVRNKITFDDYLKCLFENEEMTHEQNGIRSYHHVLFSTAQRKITLSPFDNKRFVKPNSVETLPWGHFNIMDVDQK